MSFNPHMLLKKNLLIGNSDRMGRWLVHVEQLRGFNFHPLGSNQQLASCPLGPVTANGVDLLNEIYVISLPKIKPLGPTVLMLHTCTNERMES